MTLLPAACAREEVRDLVVEKGEADRAEAESIGGEIEAPAGDPPSSCAARQPRLPKRSSTRASAASSGDSLRGGVGSAIANSAGGSRAENAGSRIGSRSRQNGSGWFDQCRKSAARRRIRSLCFVGSW